MRLQEVDLHRLIRACELYKERTSSESGEYDDLIRKIKVYLEENRNADALNTLKTYKNI